MFGSDGKRFIRRKNRERLSLRSVKKTVKFGVGDDFFSGSRTHYFHSKINASVYKELLRQLLLPYSRKGTVEIPIFMQDNATCHKAKTVLSFFLRGRNSCYEVTTTKPRHESYRECIGNHRREISEQKSSKYWGFMGFSERRMVKYHYHLL